MKKRPAQILMLLIAAGMLLSISLKGTIALETSSTDDSSTLGNSGSTLKLEIYVNSTFDNTISLSFEDLVGMPKTIIYADLSCYGILLASGQWGGVSLSRLLDRAGFSGQTAELVFHASDGYTVPFSFSNGTTEDVIVAYELDGSGLPETLRLVIPGVNGASWISMITVISINSPFYPISPNPQAASVGFDQIILQQSTSKLQQFPSATPKPKELPTTQPTTQPTVPPPTNTSVQQQAPPKSNLPEYGYSAFLAIIIAAAVATGCLSYMHRKQTKRSRISFASL